MEEKCRLLKEYNLVIIGCHNCIDCNLLVKKEEIKDSYVTVTNIDDPSFKHFKKYKCYGGEIVLYKKGDIYENSYLCGYDENLSSH
jgi:hypothetical protein